MASTAIVDVSTRVRTVLDRLVREHHEYAEQLVLRFRSSLSPSGGVRSEKLGRPAIELGTPRRYRIGDDAGSIDLSHLDHAGIDFAQAVYNGKLRISQSPLEVEQTVQLVIDLSRSMLSGCMSRCDWMESKLGSLLTGIGCVLALADASGASLRLTFLHKGACQGELLRNSRSAHAAVIPRVREMLLATADSFMDPRPERFCLAQALTETMQHRVAGYVFVVSDLLDPLDADPELMTEGFAGPLSFAMSRHRVALLDLASPQDNHFPLPPRLSVTANQLNLEGGRHLERATVRSQVKRSDLQKWNDDRAKAQGDLSELVKSRRGIVVPAFQRPVADLARRIAQFVHYHA